MKFAAESRFLVYVLAAGLLAYADAQEAPKPDSGAIPVFRSETRLVVLDVVVTDATGRPIKGLKRQDFTVSEDGKSQTISSFDERAPEITPSKPAAPLALPEHEYTNYSPGSGDSASTVVLVDAVNNNREDLVNARDQLLQFVKKLPADKKVAIYALGSGLMMLQSFTSDPKLLTAAAERLTARPGSSYTDNRQLSSDVAVVLESPAAQNPAFLHGILQNMGEQQESKLEMRTQDTFEALAQLARALAVVPGRKNLIWLSGGFPMTVDNSARLQRASEMLAETRIAVYPVDARGKVVMSATGETSAKEAFSQTEPYEDQAGLADESRMRENSMLNFARLTGGRAYIGRNDLGQEIADAMTTASSYYTIAYHSTNANWNGKYRKLQVKVGHPGAKVLCRAGYYALADPLKTNDPDRAAAIAMYRGAPTSTQLIMKARVVPPQTVGTPVAIDMLVDAHGVLFHKSEDGRQTADLQFIAVATDSHGKPSGSFSEFFRQPVTDEQFASLLKTGVQLHREMQLPAGSYQLRLGVMDRLANRIGTLDVPLTMAAATKN